MEIIRGKIPGAKKVVVYGPEGIGKSTFVSKFPDPLFIDTEGSTKNMDVARTPAPSSWVMLMDQAQYVKNHPDICRTLIIDTADWAEILCTTLICDKKRLSGIEDIGYGKGYTYVQEEFGRLLNLLEEIINQGINVVLTAHAKMRKFELPDELGSYDRWEMKLSKGVASMVKEWADMVLFANYKTFVVNVDGQGAQKGKNKAQGGKRVMYTTHHSCWDAKNRYGLADEVPFDYESIRHIIESETGTRGQSEPYTQYVLPVEIKPRPEETQVNNEPIREEPEREEKIIPPMDPEPGNIDKPVLQVDERIPKKLRDLMIANDVCEWDIQCVVENRGYFPGDMPVWEYPQDFVDGCLVGAWDKVFGLIKEAKAQGALVFN